MMDVAVGASSMPGPIHDLLDALAGATQRLREATGFAGGREDGPTESEPAADPDPEPEATVRPTPRSTPRAVFTNPVFDANAPDPAVLRGEDGAYYAYTTETDGQPFQVLRSTDLTSWERMGGALAERPGWVSAHLWAPDVQRTGDHYTMTYSGRGHDGNMRIGYATSATPQGPFQDRGVLLEGDSAGYFIDPHLEQVGKEWVLYYGSTGGSRPSDQTGISAVAVDLAADGGMRTRGDAHVVLSEAGERELVEGAWMHEREGQYYLFYSDGRWDAKGGAEDYAVKVARSASPWGPFEKLGTPILQAGGGGFTGTGHNSVVTDDAGQDWMLYHGWSPDPTKGRVLMMDPIEWRDGWPVVGQGTGPSTTAIDAPVVTAREGATKLE